MIKGLPAGIRRKVIETFVSALRDSPTFANGRVVKTWNTWDGRPQDFGATGAMPAVQVRLVGGEVKRISSARGIGGPMQALVESRPTIVLDVALPGTDQGDVCDLADAIHQVLFPQDPQARAALNARFKDAGIKDWQCVRDVLPASAESFGAAAIHGQGVFELTCFFAA
jgi:hypothetical protein